MRGISIIFCLLFVARVFAFDAESSNIFIHAECQRYLESNCTKISEGMQRSLNACQINQAAHGCDQLAASKPEIKDLILNCDAKEFCEQQNYSATAEAMGCWNGIKDSVVDTAKAIGGIFENAWQKIKADRAKRAAFVEACDKSLACKRDLAKNSIYHSKLSDEELNKYSADQLLRMEEDREIAKQYGYGYTENDPRPTATPRSPQEDFKRLQALWTTASNMAAEKYHTYSCYTPEAKQELKCYIFASLFDPSMMVGKGAKLLKARRLVQAMEEEKAATTTAREASTGTTVATKAVTKESFTGPYLHYSPTTKEQNRAWMQIAETAPKNVKYFDVENSVMKNLNDTMKDKNLVTSLTNYHKELLKDKTEKLVADLKTQYPSLEVVSYSDFKASRFAFKGQAPPDLEKRLNQVLQDTNKEFSDYVTQNKLVRAADKPETWFRAGYGDTADQATLASRFSRQAEGNTLQSYSSNEMKSTMTRKVRDVEAARSDLQSEVGHTAIMESTSSGRKVLSADAIDIVRKNSDSLVKAQADLKNRFGLSELSATSVQKMQTYVRSVDEFSPGIHIAQREVANLDDAAMGGLSADMTGMGAKNLNATAKALSDSKTLDEALAQTRSSEKIITASFNRQKATFQQVLKDTLGENRIKTVCSGDDCVAIPRTALSDNEKQKILQGLTNAGYSSEFRLSFIPDRVANMTVRTQLAVHGESIEKILRKNLADKMEPAKLKGIIFGVDMKTTQLNQGTVKLMTANSSQVRLTAAEQKMIADNFKKAVEQMNRDLINDGKTATYSAR